MHVIATAGHVDHGKSTLVHAMTGIDPDRLEEEKRRGLTIDLGFAWLRLPSGREVGIVDVPGHERFIKNMLAGVGAINVTLFTVAANEGWKPQSQEHLDILDLLGVEAAVVAITKADTVDASDLGGVTADVRRRIELTTLAGSAIVPVSATTSEGLDELLKEIESLVDRTPAAADHNRPRLWIDRVFSMKGSGTVVTGTLIDGSLAQDQEIEVFPSALKARIRSIQSHRKKVASIGPGNRTALNIAGVPPEQLTRGDMISKPGLWRTTGRLIASIRFLSHLDFKPTERGAFKFHVGSAERDAELRFLDETPEAGGRALAAIGLDEPLVVDWRDRFVLREAGRRMTIGGGVVIEPHPPDVRGRDSRLVSGARRREQAPGRAEYFDILLEEEGSLARDEVVIRTGLGPEKVEGREGVWLPGRIISTAKFDEHRRALVEALGRHHSSHPLEPGIPREQARAALDLDARTFEEIIDELARRAAIVADQTFLRLPGHAPAVEGSERDALMRELHAGGGSPPTAAELQLRFDPALIRALVRKGELIQVSSDLVYPAGWMEELKAKVSQQISDSGPISVAHFRDVVGTTRKYAVPLLEYLDQIGFTRRQGDLRVLGPKA